MSSANAWSLEYMNIGGAKIIENSEYRKLDVVFTFLGLPTGPTVLHHGFDECIQTITAKHMNQTNKTQHNSTTFSSKLYASEMMNSTNTSQERTMQTNKLMNRSARRS